MVVSSQKCKKQKELIFIIGPAASLFCLGLVELKLKRVRFLFEWRAGAGSRSILYF